MTKHSITDTFGLIDEEDFATLRGIKVSQLRNERCAGLGPAYVKLRGMKGTGRRGRVMYEVEVVRRYIAANTVTPKVTDTLAKPKPKRSTAQPSAA